MAEQDLKDLGESIGAKTEKKEKGRPPGSRGPLPNVKTMSKRDLERETGKNRKRIKELEQQIIEMQPAEDLAKVSPEGMGEQEVGGFIGWIVNSWVAGRLGDHWKLSEDEMKQAGHECAPFVNKYAPYASKWQEEIRAGVWAVATFAPRWEKTRELKAKAETQRKSEKGLDE